tara:strand:+ start:210 stop:395 length:186 start_codon:yes stop_codon:yes gene_type:complete
MNLKKVFAAFILLNVIPMMIFFAGLADGVAFIESLVVSYTIAIISYTFAGVLYWCITAVFD